MKFHNGSLNMNDVPWKMGFFLRRFPWCYLVLKGEQSPCNVHGNVIGIVVELSSACLQNRDLSNPRCF